MVKAEIVNNQKKYKIPRKKISELLKLIARKEGLTKGTFIFTFVTTEDIVKLNKEFLNRNRDTNVITFSYISDFSPEISPIVAEIFINIDRVFSESQSSGITPDERFWQLIIHGILHGLDYEHENTSEEEKQLMEEKESLYYEMWQRISNDQT